MDTQKNHFRDGPALAAILSAAIGVFILGLSTVLAVASVEVKELLNWYSPAGPLSGKSGIAIIVWLLSWGGLHYKWKNHELPFSRIWYLSIILIIISFLFTFPPFFELFHH